MFDRFLTWFDDRTSAPTLFNKVRGWSVPQSNPYARLIPAMVIFTFIVQVITGILLWTFYSPSAQTAWESLFYLQHKLPGGWLIRGIHHYAAQLMPIMLGIYLLCLVFSGRYRTPREFVFWTAFFLFLFSLGFSLTGDLLGWTLSGTSATLVRVRFLQMLPFIGEPLFRIVCGGSEFGTLTIPRFLVLHILVLGGGFFALLCAWRFFDYRAAKLEDDQKAGDRTQSNPRIPLFSNEILKYSIASFIVMTVALLLVYRTPILNRIDPESFPINEHMPRQASLGAHLGAPVDPATTYNAARPEWSFRALYHFCNLKKSNGDEIFPGEMKFIPIFVVTGCVGIYVMLIPFIGWIRVGHYFNVAAVGFLFVSLCYLTYASYHHDYIDPSMQEFRDEEAAAARLAERAVELCLILPIPPTGALTLVQNDPLIQGPVLYKQHCAMCHTFEPLAGESVHPDFPPIFSDDRPVAPNLYNPIRKEWIEGFLKLDKIRSADFFGTMKLDEEGKEVYASKFASGAMVGYVRDTLPSEIKDAADLYEVEDALDKLIDFLLSEAQLDVPQVKATEEQIELLGLFSCDTCHKTYEDSRPAIQAPDLRGYMSRDWLIGIIADPETSRFYGNTNESMPAYHRNAEDAVMTMKEIELLTDWLRGYWVRMPRK